MAEQYKMHVMNRLCFTLDKSRDPLFSKKEKKERMDGVFQLNHVTEIRWNGISVESLDIHQVNIRSVSADTHFIDLLGSLRNTHKLIES